MRPTDYQLLIVFMPDSNGWGGSALVGDREVFHTTEPLADPHKVLIALIEGSKHELGPASPLPPLMQPESTTPANVLRFQPKRTRRG